MSKSDSLHQKRLSIKDINEHSSVTEIIHVQDALVQRAVDEGKQPGRAAQEAHERIKDRTGRAYDKQFKVSVDE